MYKSEFFKSEVYQTWMPYTISEFAGMISETPCDGCNGKCLYRGFAKEKVKGLRHRHFSICKECGKVEEF